MSMFAKTETEIMADVAAGMLLSVEEIVQGAHDMLRAKNTFAVWRTVHEGRPAQPEAHPFRGTGIVLDFQRSAAGVYEMVR